jgi:enamine deaminase RidA (YjgF/YER057c/UK114 family)
MTGISQLRFISIVPDTGSSPTEEMMECLKKLESACRPPGIRNESSNEKILKLTFFIKAEDNADFHEAKSLLIKVLSDILPENYPAVSFIGQPPENDRHLALEAMVLNSGDQDVNVCYKKMGDISYTLVQYSRYQEVYAAGLTIDNRSSEIEVQSQGAFKKLNELLIRENMDLGHIVRQWNYVEDIVGKKAGEGGERQNYQVFNDVRTTFYDRATFKFGYPSATGIGMNAGGIVLEAIATDAGESLQIAPLSNPRQQDAHRYSQKVLVGIPITSFSKKTSPKFERAKLICDGVSGLIYVAGTASIRGQETIGVGDVEMQTQTTIENIAELTSPENLKQHGFQPESPAAPFSYLRVYVKNAADIPRVKKICTQAYGSSPSLYVVSDVCRPELLVEIEGAVFYPVLKPS